jgi:predicted RNase H-like nuclease (RuvC/YqgF family)
MTKENDRMRQEFSTQLQTEVQSIAKEVDVVKGSTDEELTNRVRNFESTCEGMNESMSAYKSQTDASVNSLRLEMNQNKEEVKNKVGELTLEIRSVASSLDGCNSKIQTDRQVYQLETQKLNSEIGNLKAKLNSNQTNQNASAVCTSLQASTTRLIDIGQSSSQVSPAVSEPSSHISPGVNGESVYNASACNYVNNTNTIATSCNENVSAQSETFVIQASTVSYHCLHFLIVRNK